jgi:phage terminase large subunit-like protein
VYGPLAEPTKRFLGLYDAGRLEHGNNPVLSWNAACLGLMGDGNDNFRPVKPERHKSSKRIDLVSSIINALARAPYAEETGMSYNGLMVVG